MISDQEIWACAASLVKSHGDAASVHAAQRADELLRDGDVEGHRTWIIVLERINILEMTTPAEGQMRH